MGSECIWGGGGGGGGGAWVGGGVHTCEYEEYRVRQSIEKERDER